MTSVPDSLHPREDQSTSIPVALDKLREEITARGDAAFVLTAGAGGPHVVSARIAWKDAALTAPAGSRTAANVGETDSVSILWPSSSFDDYSLIVDGTADVDGDTVVITPTRAVLHRSSQAAGDGPSCVTVL